MRLTTLCLLLLPATITAQSLPPKTTVARVVDSLAQDFLAHKFAPGVSIGVVRGTDTLVLNGWGTADIENDVPANAATVYRIGSITKQFTAAIVMQLVQEGKVRLDDSIGTYLPTLPSTWKPIPVRLYLNHTSGVPSYTDVGSRWYRRWGEDMPPDSLIAVTAHDSLWFAPGTRWRYDNTGYVVLGMLVEKIEGRPWGSVVEGRLAKPLGLSSTRNCLAQPIIPHRARGYDKTAVGWMNTKYISMTQPYAAGALCSTVGDLSRWNHALGSGQVVTAASYRQMTTPEGAATKGPLLYGFGLARDTIGGHAVITHDGGINGFITANAWFPDDQLSVTVLTNASGSQPDLLLRQVARAALGVALELPPKPVKLDPASRSRYAGVYALTIDGNSRDMTIAPAGDGLTVQLAGQPAIPLVYLGNDTFGASFDPSLRLIFRVENGRPTGVTLLQGGGRIEGPRKGP